MAVIHAPHQVLLRDQVDGLSLHVMEGFFRVLVDQDLVAQRLGQPSNSILFRLLGVNNLWPIAAIGIQKIVAIRDAELGVTLGKRLDVAVKLSEADTAQVVGLVGFWTLARSSSEANDSGSAGEEVFVDVGLVDAQICFVH